MEEVSCALRCSAQLPYPEVQARSRNGRYGAAMLSDAAGCGVSEMSAVANYIYGEFTTRYRPEVAESFHCISIVEMHHLAIFSELARQLGEEPRLWSRSQGRTRWWNPAQLAYPRHLRGLLQYAVAQERAAIRKYAQQLRWIEDENIAANLRRIIADERVHIEILTGLYDSYCQDLDFGLQTRATK